MIPANTQQPGKKLHIPDTYTLIMFFTIVATIATYIIPAGNFTLIKNAVTGQMMVDPSSFNFIEQSPVGIGQFLLSIPEGMIQGASMIFLVFLVGGFFQIINDTGAIDAVINLTVNKLESKALLIIPVVMSIMSFLGATGVVVNASIAFIPIGIALAKKLDTDPIVGAALMYVGAYSGATSTPIGFYNTMLAQKIAGLPILSGAFLRTIVWMIIMALSIYYTYRYAKKVQSDKRNSKIENFSWEKSYAIGSSENHAIRFSFRHALVIASLVTGFGVYIYGSFNLNWGLNYVSAMMMAVAMISGIICKMTPDQMAKSFITGCKAMVYGALVIGLAKSITIILTEGQIIHSIIYYMAIPLSKIGSMLSGIGMLIVNLIFNFMVPSGSGQAMIVMPLLAPLADVVHVSRQVAVSAFLYGDGFSNTIIPTSGVLMAVLGVARIPYEKWLKFMLPLFGIWTAVGILSIIIGIAIGWQ